MYDVSTAVIIFCAIELEGYHTETPLHTYAQNFIVLLLHNAVNIDNPKENNVN